MIARLALATAAILAALCSVALAQTYTPQSSSRLTVSFTTERVGSGRVLVYGEVRNGAGVPCERVVVSVEGFDENGRVVSRARGYVYGVVQARGSAPFEVRLSSPGTERRYKVEVESFQFLTTGN